MSQATPGGIPHCAFTARAPGRVFRLIGDVHVFQAFSPGAPQPVGGKYQALYDTGATHSCISPKVVADLKLPEFGVANVGVGGGDLSTTVHLVNFGMPNGVMFTMMRVAKVEARGTDVIIGMDVLGAGDFAVTHHGRKTTFSFCCPSRREIDFVNEVKQDQKALMPKVGPNDPCPCGSGKKFKKCCRT